MGLFIFSQATQKHLANTLHLLNSSGDGMRPLTSKICHRTFFFIFYLFVVTNWDRRKIKFCRKSQ